MLRSCGMGAAKAADQRAVGIDPDDAGLALRVEAVVATDYIGKSRFT